MKTASKYLLAVIVPFLLISICWSIADIQRYGDHAPTGRWQGYQPKLWIYLGVNSLILGGILFAAIKNLGSQALIPLVYGLAAGCYFYFLYTQTIRFREWEDTLFLRPFWSVVGLIPMAARDILWVAIESLRAEARGRTRRR